MSQEQFYKPLTIRQKLMKHQFDMRGAPEVAIA
jgi:hypothetical protein